MRNKDIDHFAAIEEKIIASGDKYKIDQLDDFPFTNFADLKDAISGGSFQLIAEYNGEILKSFGASLDRKSHNFWISIPFLIIFFLIVYSIYISNYYLLIGIPLALIGFFCSTPYIKSRALLYIVSLGLFIYFIVKSNSTGYFLSGSFLFSLWTAMTARDICSTALKNTALASPILFIYMLKNKIILLFDKKNDKFININ